jgi:hypothetical protein
MLHADPMDLAVELVRSGGAERDLTVYRLALELTGAMQTGAYHPPRFPAPPYELEGKTFAIVEASVANASFALVFAAWRVVVTDLEAQSAQRLLVLASTQRSLRVLSQRTSDEQTLSHIDSMLSRIASHLVIAWRIEPPHARVDLRAWSVQATRRYDLLPRAWRYL